MSLSTVPKTNFSTDDGVTTDDLNEIGQNLLDLEDSKYESGDNIVVGTITSGDITGEDLTLSGTTLLTDSPTSTTEVIATVSAWLIPRGIFNISLPGVPASASVALQIFVDSDWRNIAVRTAASTDQDSYGSAIISDGSNTRVNNLSSGSYTVYYQKF